MIYPGVKKIARDRNWLRSDSMVAGTEKGYLVNMGDGQGYKFLLFHNLSIPEEKRDIMKNDIEGIRKKYSLGEIGIDDRSVYVTIREMFIPAGRDRIVNALGAVADILHGHGIPTNDICMECGCGDQNTLHYINIHNINFNLCGDCAEKMRYEQQQERDRFVNADGNYLRGMLGALIFSLPAVALWIIMAVYLDRIAAAVSALIFILSMKGYKRFGGKTDVISVWIMLAVNIIMIVLSNYATVAYILYVNHHVPPERILSLVRGGGEITGIIYHQIALSAAVCMFMWGFLVYLTYRQTRFPELIKSRGI